MAATRTNGRGAYLLALGLMLTLNACGRVAPTGGVPSVPVSVTATPTPFSVAPVVPIELPVATPLQSAPVAALPTCEAVSGCHPYAQLVVGNVQKKKAGLLWRKLRIQAEVTNRGPQPLDGEIIVRFKKNGRVVQSEFVAFALLGPGQSKPVELVSSVAADDVEVTTRLL
jgi:hypothetical protein